MSTTDQIVTYPIMRDGYPFTIREVHDGDLLGMVTLRGEAGEVIVAASEVPRRLYRVIVVWPGGERLGPITGGYGQPIDYTWNEATEAVERFMSLVGQTSPTGTVFKIEVGS